MQKKRHYTRFTRNSAVANIALEREEKKKRKRNCYNTGYSYFVLQERRRAGLTLLSELNETRCWHCNSSLDISFFKFLTSLKR